jgi:L-fuconolactonase
VIVDTHVHVACADSARYPRAPRGVGSDWWRTEDRGAASLAAAIDAAGVDRAVVVQAIGPYGYDCRCAIDAVAERPDRLTLVVAVDPDSPSPAGALRTLARDAPVAGVRVFCVGGGPVPWLDDGRAAEVWDAAGDLGIPVVPVVMPQHIPAVRKLIASHPSVTVALDHAGFPVLPLTDEAPLLTLADLPAVHLKVSSHLLESADDPAALVSRLGDTFGSVRLCWGSDFPQTSLDYGSLLALGHAAAEGLAAAARDDFLGATAARLWPSR